MQPADCKNRRVPLISPSRGEKEGGKKKKKIPSSSERRWSEKTCFSLISNRGSFFFSFPACRRRSGFVEDHSGRRAEKTLMKGARHLPPTWRFAGPLATSGSGGGL